MRLTEHFSLGEFAVSKSRPDLVEPVPLHFIPNIQRLAESLEVIRKRIGQPVRILSGYRSAALNRAIEGSGTSQHMLGQAVDITADDLPLLWQRVVAECWRRPSKYGQVIFYPERGFIHLALPSPRYAAAAFHVHRPPFVRYRPVTPNEALGWAA